MSLVRYNSKIIITVALISLLSACTRENSLKDTQNKRSGESQAIVDARQFFSEHPEYISSAETRAEAISRICAGYYCSSL